MIVNRIGVLTLIQREMTRTFKILNQVIWPPIITTVLYVSVFGLGLGSRIKDIDGVPYAQFLVPGLLMLQVIDGAYGEGSSSLFQAKFMGSITELLVAPLSASELLIGYIVAGILRAGIISVLILSVAAVMAHVVPHNWPLTVFVIALVASLFSAIGIIFGLRAEKFDQIAIFTTFVITPLTFVGGVFTSLAFLPPVLRSLSLLNPIAYMIDALRYAFTAHSDMPFALSLIVLFGLNALAIGVAYRLIATGYKLRV